MALITGCSPTEIENNWSVEDVNWVLMVKRAQEEARIAIASIHQVQVADVLTPTSLELRKDDE